MRLDHPARYACSEGHEWIINETGESVLKSTPAPMEAAGYEEEKKK